MFLIIFCLLESIVAQPFTGRVNTNITLTRTQNLSSSTIITNTVTSTVTNTPLSIQRSSQTPTNTPSQTPTHTPSQTPTYILRNTPTYTSSQISIQSVSQILTESSSQTSLPTYYSINYDSNTSVVTPTQSPTPGTIQTYNISISLSPSPSNLNNILNNINTNIINNSTMMTTSNIIGIVIGSILILSTTISILGYYYTKNINKSRSPVSSTMSEKDDSKISIQENPVLEPIQENNHIKKRWTQCVDGTDTWYVSSDGESVWVLPEGAVLEN
jgi:hypothetical protein